MLGRLTQLDAVNEVLSALGEKPVATLEGQTSQNARLALNELNSTSRQIQSEGWNFNMAPCLTLSVDAGTGEIAVPANLIRFDVPDEPHVVARGSKLYDRAKHTFQFDAAITGNAIVLLEWDDMPEEIRRYVTAQSAKKLYDQFVGAQEGRRNLYDEALVARARALDMDCEVAGYNTNDDPTMPYLRGSYLVPGAPRDGFKPIRTSQ
jgi:hypothetical protein